MNRAFDLPPILRANRPLQTADDSCGQRAIKAKWISNRQNFLSYDKPVRVSHGHDSQRFLWCFQQSDDRKISVGIAPNYSGGIVFSAAKTNRELLSIGDHMIVGEDIALLVDNRS